MNLFKSISVSSFYLVISYILRFSLTYFIARAVSVGEMGIYSWAITAFGVLSIIIIFGQDFFLLKRIPEYANNKRKLKQVLGFSLKIIFFLSLISILIIFASSLFFQKYSEIAYIEGLIILSFALPMASLNLINCIVLRTNDRPLLSQVCESLIQPAILIFLIIISYYLLEIQLNSFDLFYFNLIGWVVCITFSLYFLKGFYKTTFPLFLHNNDSHAWKKDSSNIFSGVLAWSFLGRSDVLILAFFVNPEDVARYFVCMRIAESLLFFATISHYLWSGEASVSFQNGDIENVKKLFRRSIFLSFMFCCSCFILFYLFSSEILSIFGSDYVGSETVLIYCLLGCFILGSVGLLVHMFYILGDVNFLAKAQWLSGMVFLILISLTVPKMGIVACSISFASVQILYIVLLYFRLRYKHDLSLF